MPATASIIPTNQKSWTNRHDTVHQALDNIFDVRNGNSGNLVDDYNATTKAIQGFIADAIAKKKVIRALGGGWSFSAVAATEGWLVNTKLLNMIFEITNPGSVSTRYQGRRDLLLFAQCGISVQELNRHLRKTNRSLKTSGASNGQSIVGAFSTCTHGSAIDFGSTPDFIVGLHVIVSPTKTYYIERSSYPVASDSFVQRIGAELLRDDDIFNSALVSFGSFGFIHGVMLESEDIYLLECYRLRFPLNDALKKVMDTLDFSKANFLPHANQRPFHFQVVVNQYDLKNGAYSTIMYKRPFNNNYTPPVVNPDKAGPGDDVPAVLGKLTELLPVVTPLIVNNLVKSSFVTFSNVRGTSGEIFTNMDTRGRLLSTAFGIPISFVTQVNQMLIDLNTAVGPFSGIFSYRYVKQTKALFGFTIFEHTCVVELDGVDNATTNRFYDKVWNELIVRNIPHTFHWGKISNLRPADIRRIYGSAVTKWIKARNTILPVDALEIFNTPLLKEWGLDTILPRPF